jgi:hypothetical protein
MREQPKRKRQRERVASSKWATFRQIADEFCVEESTVRKGLGVFARLRRVPLGEKRTVVPRADVDKLHRELERAAVALSGEVVSLDERRKTA